MAGTLSMPPIPDLPGELRRLLAQVPSGRVTSFGDLAEALGDIGAARWVATEIATLRDEMNPWHRVVKRTGELPGDADRQRWQRQRLSAENAVREPLWTAFDSTRPLRALADWQTESARLATFHEALPLPDRVGAVDLSYVSDTEAIAAYAAVDAKTLQLVDSDFVRVSVPFPYIPGYLTFREIPALLALVERVRDRIAPMILVDGSGRLHPRRFGVAVALGVLAGLRTVDVSKHRLCGRPRGGEGEALWVGDELLGYRLDGGSKRRTMYVSPGSGTDAASAVAIVRAVWRERRSPEPIHWADAISRREAKQ